MSNRILIPIINVSKFEKAMRQLVSLSKKLDSGEIHFKKVDERIASLKNGSDIMHYEYEFSGEAPIINGYRMIAKITHIDGENYIQKIEDDADLPEGLINRPPYCEHCNVDRYRKHLFLLQEMETEEVIQVGKTCLKDFTGMNNNPEDYADWFSQFYLIRDLQEYHGIINPDEIDFPIDEIIAISIYYQDDADQGENISQDTVIDKLKDKDFKDNMLTKKHFELVSKVKEWVLDQDERAGYVTFKDLQFFLKGHTVRSSNVERIANIYSLYKKETTIDRSLPGHVFNVGDQLLIRLTLNNIDSSNKVLRFSDRFGNVFIYHDESGLGDGLGTSCIYTVRAILFKHSTVNEERVNVLSDLSVST